MAWHRLGYHSSIPLGIQSHRLSACWQSGSAVHESLTDNSPWLWFHLAKHSVTRTRGREKRADSISCEHNYHADALVQLMTATEIEHVYTINSDETVRLHVYVQLQWLLQKQKTRIWTAWIQTARRDIRSGWPPFPLRAWPNFWMTPKTWN